MFTRTSRKLPAAAGMIVAVAIATGACSAPAAAGPTAAPIAHATQAAPPTAPTGATSGANPCLLVTDADAAALLGGAPTRTGPKEEARGVACTWDTADGGNLLVAMWQGKEFYAPEYSDPTATTLSGLGDKAYVNTATQTVGFIKGSTVVVVFVPALRTVPIADIERLAHSIADAL